MTFEDHELQRAIRDEAYRPAVLLTPSTLQSRLEAQERAARARRPWFAGIAAAAGLAIVVAIAALSLPNQDRPGGLGPGASATGAACAASRATGHGSWFVEIGGPNAFFNIEPGTLYATGDDSAWLIITRFDPGPGPAEAPWIWAQAIGSGERVDGSFNSPMDPANIYRLDQPAPDLPGDWYLFEQRIPTAGCWRINAEIAGRIVGSAIVDVGPGRPAPINPGDSFVPATPVRAEPRVICGRLSQEVCAKTIQIVRDAHPGDVAAAWGIVVDDTCPPPWICDRVYPFMSAVALVRSPPSMSPPLSFLVIGVGSSPERIEGSAEPLPAHIVELIESLR